MRAFALGAVSALALMLAHPCDTRAQHPAEPPTLRWGADQEGGGPFVYQDEQDPSRVRGFEVDIAAELNKELGRKTEFVQGTWDMLPAMLGRGDIDLVLNGYEYTPERAQQYLASIPYFIYEMGLVVRKNDPFIQNWDDLRKPARGGRRRAIAVLAATGVDEYVTKHFGDTCDILRFDGCTEALHQVESGQVDATAQDLPILDFYITKQQQYAGCKVVGDPVWGGYYVAYARPDDRQLIEGFNNAIRRMDDSGRLREIYEKYNMWNETQLKLPEKWENWDSSLQTATMSKWQVLSLRIIPLIKASGVTVALSVLSMPLAIAIGLIVALIRAWDTPTLGGSARHASPVTSLLRSPSGLYVEIVRGTPLAFQLFVVYFVLPEFGVNIGPFWSGVIGLAINYSAYESEIFRLGLQAIPRGQMEAALSLGMSRGLAVRRIILPQAVRIVIPATANDFIALFKDTAVCSVIAVEELSKQYQMGAKSTGLFIEIAVMASILYLAMSYPLSLLSRWLERRLKRDPLI